MQDNRNLPGQGPTEQGRPAVPENSIRVEDCGHGMARLILDQTMPWADLLAVLDLLRDLPATREGTPARDAVAPQVPR